MLTCFESSQTFFLMIASFLSKARDIILRIEKRDLYKCIGQTILKKTREKVKN